MKDWLRGKCGSLIAFLAVAVLVAGGLGWATVAALRLENEQIAERAEAERASKIRLALWRLDSPIAPLLAREDSRPVDQYSAIYSPPLALYNTGDVAAPGAVIVPSPLLYIELPEWMLLHFQADQVNGWDSPQILSDTLTHQLRTAHVKMPLDNVTRDRHDRLQNLEKDLSATELILATSEHSSATVVQETSLQLAHLDNNNFNNNTMNPQGQQGYQPQPGRAESQVRSEAKRNYEARNNERSSQEITVYNPSVEWFNLKPSKNSLISKVLVQVKPMRPFWLTDHNGVDHLVMMRLVQLHDRHICQGILLDEQALTQQLTEAVTDLFPEARILPMKAAQPVNPDCTMTALPFELDPGPAPPLPDPGWTPVRVGLALAWSAALIALVAVGAGGWSLLNFSERRIRFVSAVTHELRTPLTTLRLYLDMLMNGLVRDDKQREEYIATLHAEAERLNRLVGNVLDFSRLEKQRPTPIRAPLRVADLLELIQTTWQGRCTTAGKQLLVDSALPADMVLCTDGQLLQQVVGNLIDNACKYSRSAGDRRLWLRARQVRKRVSFEVEDRGPGVPSSERRIIFHAFRRGRDADVTAGGVGLGLALAKRWAHLLGGRLTLAATPAEGGACFRLELPFAEC